MRRFLENVPMSMRANHTDKTRKRLKISPALRFTDADHFDKFNFTV